MIATDTQHPIATEPESKSEGLSGVGVHIGSPLMELVPEFCPKGNFIGASAFGRMMQLALSQAGILDGDVVSVSGDFNDMVVVAIVTDRAKAVEIIRHELGQIALLSLAQIGVREDRSWHCVFPSPAVRLNWLLDTERHQIRQQQLLQLLIERMAQLHSGQQTRGSEPGQQ